MVCHRASTVHVALRAQLWQTLEAAVSTHLLATRLALVRTVRVR